MLGVTGLALAHNLWSFGRVLVGAAPPPPSLTPPTLWLNCGIALLLAALAIFVAGEAARVLRQPRPGNI